MLLSDFLSHEMIQQQGKPKVGTEMQCRTVRTGRHQFGCGRVAQLMPIHQPLLCPRTAPDAARRPAVVPPCLFQADGNGDGQNPRRSLSAPHGRAGEPTPAREARGTAVRCPRAHGRAQPLFLFLLPPHCGARQSEPLFSKCYCPGAGRPGSPHATMCDVTSPTHGRCIVCAQLFAKLFLPHVTFLILTPPGQDKKRGRACDGEKGSRLPEPLSPRPRLRAYGGPQHLHRGWAQHLPSIFFFIFFID